MNSFLRFSLGVAFALVVNGSVFADVTLAPLFRDGAVLQRDQPLPVWGRAAAGEKVRVQFHAQSADATTGGDGRWRVTLKPEKVSTESAELVVSGTNTLRLHDIVVGDVWLC